MIINEIFSLSKDLDKKSKNIVYCALNTLNNKVYIGYTQQTLNDRKKSHISHAKWEKDNTYFHNAINKYGKENFQWFVIFQGFFLEELKEKEKQFIKRFKSNDKQYGYNLTSGGEQCYFNESVKLKISKRAKERGIGGEKNPFYGKRHSLETRKRWSKIRRGRPCSNPGYTHSNEIKKILSEKAKIRNANPEFLLRLKEKAGKPVICLNNNIKYLSLKDAAKELSINYSSLKSAFRKNKSHKGYNFKYANV